MVREVSCVKEKARERERQETDRDRQTDRQTDRNRETKRERERGVGEERNKKKEASAKYFLRQDEAEMTRKRNNFLKKVVSGDKGREV